MFDEILRSSFGPLKEDSCVAQIVADKVHALPSSNASLVGSAICRALAGHEFDLWHT
jgi:hypothetical protein